MILAALPQVSFADYNVAAVEERLFALYTQITGRTIYPGQPERLFLDTLAVEVSRLLYNIDYSGRMNLLAYARVEHLDGLAAFFGVSRLPAAAARTTLRFSLQAPQALRVAFDAGIRATPEGGLWFRTLSGLVFEPGETSVLATAVCEAPGVAGNGWLPGQVAQLERPLDLVKEVRNETLSLGGCEAEDDGRLRERVALAPEAWSTAGPVGAYVYYARSVSAAIHDVAVWSPEPGRVHLALLCAEGQAPTSEILAAAAAVLGSERVRPLTDTVVVQAPYTVEYTLDLSYWIQDSMAAKAATIAAGVAAAVAGWIVWQRERLGRSLRPSELIARVQAVLGVHSVEVASPGFVALEPWELAVCAAKSLTYQGVRNG